MQLLAGLLSLALNAIIVAFVGLLLLVASGAMDPDDVLPRGADAPAPTVVVVAWNTPRDVVVQLFEWRWDDVAVECETFLGPQGFDAVQVSPPNEHRLVAGYPWWQRYQPVSYVLGSRSGDSDAFADMVRRCAAAGVKVYVDAVINHMTGQRFADDPLWGTGSAGSRYDFEQYPDYGPDDFHQPYCEIGDRYGDRAVVQNCALAGLADLDTEADRVQDRIGAYLNGLQDRGVAGFRIDAARHIAAADIAGILSRVQGLPFIYQDVLEGPGEAVHAREYLGNGAVTQHDYGRRLSTAFRDGNIAMLRDVRAGLGIDDLVPSDAAVVFVDSHDTQRGEGGGGDVLTHRDGALYDLANVFMLAWPYGTPRVMSSYRFTDASAGPPSAEDGTTRRVHGADGLGCGSAWLCEHRRPAIAGMVGFRNATAGAEVDNWWSDEAGGRIAFGRGDRGFVIINNTDEPMRQWLRTGLPAGRYCNVLASRSLAGVCRAVAPRDSDGAEPDADAPETAGGDEPSIEIVVSKDTSATVELPPRSAVAIYVSRKPTADPVPPEDE